MVVHVPVSPRASFLYSWYHSPFVPAEGAAGPGAWTVWTVWMGAWVGRNGGSMLRHVVLVRARTVCARTTYLSAEDWFQV